MLPDSGPRWKELAITPEYGAPLDPITLLYRDPLEAVADLLARPVFANAMEFAPRKIWKDVDRSKRVYSEMSSGNWWWRAQVCDRPSVNTLTNTLRRVYPKAPQLSPSY
jgi:lambda repressor-like predicted transcriptional regulator